MCNRTGESIFEVANGETRTFCINFAVCPKCGAVLNGQQFVGRATSELGNHGNTNMTRKYTLVSPARFMCGCSFESVDVYNQYDGIPADMAIMGERSPIRQRRQV